MDKNRSDEILDYLKRIDESINGPRRGRSPKRERPLTERMESVEAHLDKLGTRVSEVQLGLATLAANTKTGFKAVDARFDGVDARFDQVDARFDRVEGKIESSRDQLVDLVTRVHDELTGRLVDVERPGTGGSGRGGRGSGGSGVPLTS